MTEYELDIGVLKKRLVDPKDLSTQDLDDLPYAVTVADRFGREWWPNGWAQRWVTTTGARSIGLTASQLAEKNGPIGLSDAAAAASELIDREADVRSVRIPWQITDQGTWKREEAWRQQDQRAKLHAAAHHHDPDRGCLQHQHHVDPRRGWVSR